MVPVIIHHMGDLNLGPPGPTAPHATHEFRLEQAVRDTGHAYVRYRDGGAFHAVTLIPSSSVIYVGRDRECAVRVQDDERVSRRHARLIFGAGRWSIQDGPSRNGTIIGLKRIAGEEILSDGDIFTVGRTLLSFHLPSKIAAMSTQIEEPPKCGLHPTATQHKVLIELVRSVLEGRDEIPILPSNPEIAEKLHYEVATVRDAISDLYHEAGLRRGEIDQRAALVRLAIRERVVTPDDLRS